MREFHADKTRAGSSRVEVADVAGEEEEDACGAEEEEDGVDAGRGAALPDAVCKSANRAASVASLMAGGGTVVPAGMAALVVMAGVGGVF
jgi:hypothetical protein